MAHIERESDGNYSVIHDGRVVLTGEGYQVASNVADAINRGAHGTTECDEVARVIVQAKLLAEQDAFGIPRDSWDTK